MIVQKVGHGNSFATPTSPAIPKSKADGGVKMALLLLVMGLRYSTDQRFRPCPSLIPTSGNLTQTSQVGPMKSTRPATPPTNAYIYLTLPMRRVLTSPSRFHSKWTTLRLNPLPKTTQRRPSSSTLMLAKNGSKFFATRAYWYRYMCQRN